MTRLITITALAVSLLLWSAPAYSVSSHEFSDEMLMADPTCRSTAQSAQCGNPHCQACLTPGHRGATGIHGHGVGVPIIGLPSIGLPSVVLPYVPLPGHGVVKRFGSVSDHDFAQRLSGVCSAPKRPMPVATVPVPVGPPPSTFVGGFFMPQQYQQVQPMVAGHGFPPGHLQPQGSVHALGFVDPQGNFHLQGFINSQGAVYLHGFVDAQDRFHPRSFVDAQGNVHPRGFIDAQGNFHPHGYFDAQGNAYPRVFVDAQGRFHPRVFVDAQGNAHQMGFGFPMIHGFPMGYAYAHQGSGFLQGQAEHFPEQRIVYVPFAQPPPIHVHRHGMGVPLPRPHQIMRRLLGDANMYEYPQMPLQLYTTRGPRDFLAPHPPSIGH